MAHGRGFCRENFFGVVQFSAFKFFEAGDFIERQFGEQAQETTDVGIFRIAPKLPVIIDRQHIVIEPNRALRRLAHFCPR